VTDWPILSTVTFLPLVGALIILFIGDDTEQGKKNIRSVTLLTTVFTFLLSLLIWINFDAGNPGFQMVERTGWIAGLEYHMGVDGISMLFVILTTFLMPFCILASWESVNKQVRNYMVAFLLLETLMIGVFCALDLVLFYLFFEAGLIPMFIIIGVWGGKRRVYASYKFFLYTLVGSVLMLLAMMAMYWTAGTSSIPELLEFGFSAEMQFWLWIAFFASFAAIGQRNIKRLMAYSSIGHMGFALVGLAAGSQQGVYGVVLYMVVYLAMTLGVFGIILAMRTKDGDVEEIDDMAGLSQTNPVIAVILTMLLFSLAGIPPLAGFWAKWYVFSAAIETGLLPLYVLAVVGVLASVVGAFYYIRIIQLMWFTEPEDDGFVPMAGELRVVVGLSSAFVLLYVVFGSWVEGYAETAAATFF
jgi:NADH:ubiquinone oxidoreductase subunit 4 (subunit M)